MKFFISVLMTVLFLNVYGQSDSSGFILRCYNASTLADPPQSYFLFALFIPGDKLERDSFDSLKINNSKHDFYFAEQLLSLFNFEAIYISNNVKRTFIENKECVLNRSIVLSEVINQKGFEYILKIDSNYYYRIFVDKVRLSYCNMVRRNDFELLFKKVIALNKQPVFEDISTYEKIKIISIFGKLKRSIQTILFLSPASVKDR